MKSTPFRESDATHGTPAVRHIRANESDALSARLLELVGDDPLLSFSRRCGVNEGTLRNIIKSGAMPRTDHLIAIADAANVSIEWLAAGRGPKQRGASALPATAQPEPTINLEDLDRLTMAMEAVEEGLGPRYNHATPKQRAQLVAAAYDLLLDMDQKSNVIKFIKLAA